MRSGKTWLNRNIACVLLAAVIGILALVFLVGCAPTITPHQVQSSQASWDGNEQNSGFIGFDAAGNGIITWRAHSRYIGLIADYGYRFTPKLEADEGTTLTTTNTWLIDGQHLAYFDKMSRWKKQGK